MTKLKDSIEFYWDQYKHSCNIIKTTPHSSLISFSKGKIEILRMILEEKIIDYYDGNSIDSENRAHAEMVLEILGVY